jgi:hypothetical protein
VFQIGGDTFSARGPQCGLAMLHGRPPSQIAAGAAVAPQSKFPRSLRL